MGRSRLRTMFRGAAKVTLDDKGRMVIPARYRERLLERSAGQLVFPVDRDGECLLLYPLNDWEHVEQRYLHRKPRIKLVKELRREGVVNDTAEALLLAVARQPLADVLVIIRD